MLTTEAEKPAAIRSEIARLAAQASIEINVVDDKYLTESRALLPEGTRIYVSHLPRQSWEATIHACESVRRAGFQPVPHLPVRLLNSEQNLTELLSALHRTSNPAEVLLISGDYAEPAGPYHAVAQVLAAGLLENFGFRRVSIAGHPEGHPRVGLEQIREAEKEKMGMAAARGLDARLVTQFLFEPAPFIDWVDRLRQHGLDTRFVCGLAGPAKISTLMRYALRCGVGPSIRALGSHHNVLKSLLGDHGPDRMLRQLAQSHLAGACRFDGVHLFCFGGFLRTARWLSAVAAGDFRFNITGGFDV